MTITTSAPAPAQAATTGDGTTARERFRRRADAARWPVLAVLALALAVLVSVVLRPETSVAPFAPDNAEGDGARALAQVLQQQGVRVEHTTSVAEAVGLAGPGTTLLVALDYGMDAAVAGPLVDTGAALVLVAPGPGLLAVAAPALRLPQVALDGDQRAADCTDPDAQAAEELASRGTGLALTDDGSATGAVLCFGDGSGAGHYAVVDGDPAVRVLDDPAPLTNDQITEHGHAALGLRMLGHEDRLVWLLPEPPPVGGGGGAVPPWLVPALFHLLVVAGVAAVWRGRRLGPVVPEDLPVVVRSSETTRGRGRLYRRARAYGHAGAALRAGAADRMAARLGLPRSAGAPELVDAVGRASGRTGSDVHRLVYGPPPTSDVELTRLATELDDLEREVHRP